MTRVRVISALVGFALVTALAATAVLYAQPSKAVEQPTIDFGGKAALVELKTGLTVNLHEPKVRRIGDRQYVGGRVEIFPGPKRDAFAGSTTWVPLDDVARIGVFQTMDVLAQAHQAADLDKK